MFTIETPMKVIPAWLNRLINAGVDKVSFEDRHSVIIINTLSFVTSVMVFGIGIFFYFLTHSKLLIVGVAFEGTAFASLILLNSYGKNPAAKYGTLLIHSFSAIYFGALLGMALSLELVIAFLIVFLVGGSYLIFRSFKMIAISLCLIVVLSVLIEVNNFCKIIEPIKLTHLNLFLFRWFSIGGMFVLILAVTFFFAIILKAADESRKRFLRDISHDLRASLSSIKASTDVLNNELSKSIQQHPELSELKQYVEKLVPATRYGINILNNILDLSKIEAGQPSEIVKTNFHLPGWIDDMKMIVEPLADEKKQKLVVKLDRAQVPVMVKTDSQMISQVFINLASNAIKYGPENSEIIIKITGNQNIISISVSNSGPGIPKNRQRSIFDPYETSDNRTQGGNGLGLHIVSQIVARLKGELTLESNPGQGAIFTFTIPCYSEEIERPRMEGSFNFALLKGKKVLVIDDDPMIQKSMQMLFKGSDLYEASNGADGIRVAIEIVPDMIFLDAHMPVMSGIQALGAMRSYEILKNVPIIMASSDAFGEAGEEFLAAGANDFLRKPIGSKELGPVVSRLI